MSPSLFSDLFRSLSTALSTVTTSSGGMYLLYTLIPPKRSISSLLFP